jgi:hypothetical protein
MRTRAHATSGFLALSLLGTLAAGCAHAPPPPARVYTPAPTKADAMGPVVPPVYMHLVADEQTVLERASDDGWAAVCLAPCNGYVPAFGNYRASVPGKDPTPPFTLPAPPGTHVALKVDGEGQVWTLDSVELAARRAQRAARWAPLLGGWVWP